MIDKLKFIASILKNYSFTVENIQAEEHCYVCRHDIHGKLKG